MTFANGISGKIMTANCFLTQNDLLPKLPYLEWREIQVSIRLMGLINTYVNRMTSASCETVP